MWMSRVDFMESNLSFHSCVGRRGQTQLTRLSQKAQLPTEPSSGPSGPLFKVLVGCKLFHLFLTSEA